MSRTEAKARETFAQFEYRNSLCSNHWLNAGEHVYRRGRNRCKKCGKHPLRPNMNEMDALTWFTFRPAIIRQFQMAGALWERLNFGHSLRVP